MIKLEVANYCHPCRFFEPEVIGPDVGYSGDDIVYQSDTIIRCSNHSRCEALFEQFEKTNQRSGIW